MRLSLLLPLDLFISMFKELSLLAPFWQTVTQV